MAKKNVLFIFIDALRYDLMRDDNVRKALMPNIDRLLKNGFFVRVVANAGATQFVLPSLLTQTYPLDYGGYNTGIANRPRSIFENIKEAGYTTYAAASSYLYPRVPGFFRGFDKVRGLFGINRVVNKLIVHQLAHELKLWQAGEKTDEEIIETVRHWFTTVLGGLADYGSAHPKTYSAHKFRRRNQRLAPLIYKELELLERDPQAVLKKLVEVDSFYYWSVLGREKAGPYPRLARLSDSLWSRFMRPLFWTCLLPRHLRHQEMPIEELINEVPDFISESDAPWFVYLHILNIHSFQVPPGFRYQLRKYRLLFRCLRARREAGRTWQPLMHDLTLMDLDIAFGKLFEDLRVRGDLDNTTIMVMGDHGISYGDKGSNADSERGFRTHQASLDTVLLLSDCARTPPEGTMIDSLGVGATILDALRIDGHPSFKGISALDGGREYVISETAGRGNCDIERKDLFFTVTSKTHKLFTALVGSELQVRALVDLREDPDELNDIKDIECNQAVIQDMLNFIYQERSEILQLRGFLKPAA